jgi:cullin-4
MIEIFLCCRSFSEYPLDKDVFRTFYYRALAKRLLLGRSASDFHEKKVIELLSEGKSLSLNRNKFFNLDM